MAMTSRFLQYSPRLAHINHILQARMKWTINVTCFNTYQRIGVLCYKS